MPPPSHRIAMWSGPRNISTAMMRSFAARGDCEVVDEPLYAHYLRETGLEHPGRDEVLASQPNAWQDVAAQLDADGAQPIRYVKHMSHHLLPHIRRDWLAGWTNAFLLRDPIAMLTSLDKVLPYPPRLVDTGLPQQLELFELLGGPVVAAEDILADPPGVLSALCDGLGIPWTRAMLSWPAGSHPADGVWARHWYDAVTTTTTFGAPRPPATTVPDGLEDVASAAQEIHDQLTAHRIGAAR